MLRPGRMASPAPARAFTFELSPPESPHEGVEYNYAGKSANSRGRTCTGKTSSRMGCKQRTRRRRNLRAATRSFGIVVEETSARELFPSAPLSEQNAPVKATEHGKLSATSRGLPGTSRGECELSR